MMNDTLTRFLDQVGNFSDDFKSELEVLSHIEIYKDKQIIHAAGQVETKVYLIESGFARSYYYDYKGKDHTVRFWTSGEVLFFYEGYIKAPSLYYTEFMETSIAIALSYSDLRKTLNKFPETSILIKYELLQNRKEEYERQNLLTLPANERYERLLEHNHAIFQKSPAKYIASYLNMSRETLARLMGRH